MKETIFKSTKLMNRPTGWERYALVQWVCPTCVASIMIHEVAGEDHEPDKCPFCGGKKLEWNSAYAADENGNITE